MEQLRFQRMVVPIKKEYHPIGEINNKSEPSVKSDYDIIKMNDITVIQILLTNATFVESKRFKLFLDNLVDNSNRKIVVDLRKCKLIDSTFWGALIYAQRKIHNLDGSIRIVFDAQKQSVLIIATRMDKIFKMYEDVQQAVDSFKKVNLGQTLVEAASDFS